MSIVLRGGEPPKLAGCLPPVLAAANSTLTAGQKIFEASGRYLVSYIGPTHIGLLARQDTYLDEYLDNNVQITKVVIDGQVVFSGASTGPVVGMLHQYASGYSSNSITHSQASSAVFGEGGFLIESSIEVWARYITNGKNRNALILLSPIQ